MSVMEESNRSELLADKGIQPSQLAHIVLRTPQFAQMRAFYLKLLNAHVAWESDFACFMSYDEEHHRIVIMNMPHLAPVGTQAAGLEHFAFTYRKLGALLANYARLREEGIHPVWCVNHGFTTSIYYADPDGNMIETQFDNMTADEANCFMRAEYFAKNPVGVDFDPEVLLERYRNGDPISELVEFKSAPYAPGLPKLRPANMTLAYDEDGDLL